MANTLGEALLTRKTWAMGGGARGSLRCWIAAVTRRHRNWLSTGGNVAAIGDPRIGRVDPLLLLSLRGSGLLQAGELVEGACQINNNEARVSLQSNPRGGGG